MAGDARVTVYPDREALSLAAAGLFALEARRAAQERGRCDAFLSGGETPHRCYQLLAAEPLAGTVPWRALHLFWGDERHVPHDDPQSNFGMARRALLGHLPPGEAQVNSIPYGSSPAESAARYEELLRSHFGEGGCSVDIVLLGLGEDGHTASLFPGDQALNERERWACAVHLPGKVDRVTVTAPLLNRAALVVFLVSGSGKAEALRQVLEGPYDPQRLPAQLVRPEQGRVIWLVDREAARLLSTTHQGDAS